MAERAFITGRGVCSAFGAGWPSFRDAISAGRVAPLVPFPSSEAEGAPLCHAAPLPEGSGRNTEPLTALATAAAAEALRDAGIVSGAGPLDSVGLVMATALGPATSVERYLEVLEAKGPRASRPALFVDTLLSMPASRIGIELGLRGSTAVLGASSPFEVALEWLRQGRERMLVAGSGDIVAPKCARYHRELAARSGHERAPLGQGAAFVVLEAGRRPHTTLLGELLGAGGASEPQEVSVPWSTARGCPALAQAMRCALADAGLAPSAVSAITLAAGDDTSEREERSALGDLFGPQAETLTLLRPKRLLGEALSASSAFSLLAALCELGARPGVALVNAFELGGGATSLVLASP